MPSLLSAGLSGWQPGGAGGGERRSWLQTDNKHTHIVVALDDTRPERVDREACRYSFVIVI